MWIPKSEVEILAAIKAGDLSETAIFDAKMALPAKGRSKDLAIDVAAMANDGGTLRPRKFTVTGLLRVIANSWRAACGGAEV